MKKRISIWLHGGVGTGHFNQGSPMLEYVLKGLAESFDLVVYSMLPPNEDYRTEIFKIRTAPRQRRNKWIRWFMLTRFFLVDHRAGRFDSMLAFWGWPTGFLVVLLSRYVRIPSAVYLMGGDAAGVPSVNYGILHKPLLRKIALWTYRSASILLGISKYQRDLLLSFGLAREMTVIPWGVDTALFKFNFKVPGEVLHFIHVGHSSPVKDQATLIRAFATINKHRPSELRIIGADCMDGAMQALCKQLSIDDKVRFEGMVPYINMPSHYAWADIMLHTSLSEGQCLALTEAASTGVLMAGTPVGLLYDFGEDFGITVDFGDHQQLAGKVLQIFHHPEGWRQKVENAKRWSDEHTLEWTVKELAKCLDDL